MNRIDTRLKLSEETAAYVKEQQEAKGLSSLTKTIEHLLQEHKNEEEKQAEQAYFTSMMMDAMQNKVEEEFHRHLKQLQLGVNNTDRNSQILLEMMNGFMIYNDIPHMMTTSDYESPTLTTAKEEVRDRIAHQKQRKDDAKNKRWNQ